MTPPRFRSQADLFAEQPGLCVARLPPCAVVVTPPDANRGRLGLPSPQCSKEGPGAHSSTSGFFMSAVVNFSSTLNEPAGVVSLASQGWGVVKSLELIGSGPVGLVHTQNFQFFKTENPLLGSEATLRIELFRV